MLDREDIDLIDICVPNHLHCDIAVAALSAGKMVATEKPLAMWLNGPIVELSAITETFIKERNRQDDPATLAKVEIDDASQCMVRFANGSIGTFEATRYACCG